MRGARVATQPSETGGRGKTSGERAESEVSFFFLHTVARRECERSEKMRGERERFAEGYSAVKGRREWMCNMYVRFSRYNGFEWL